MSRPDHSHQEIWDEFDDDAALEASSKLPVPFSRGGGRLQFVTGERSHQTNDADPHGGERIVTAGPAVEAADAVLILVHGRGATAQSMLTLYDELAAANVAAIAPQAAGQTWYPHSFLAPIESNEPYLSSALRRLETIVADLLARAIPGERIALLGFSQGACLTAEYIARHPRRYGGAIVFTGGLIGPPGTPRDYAGSLDGTPVFLGAGDPDPHVPFERVLETQQVLARMGAQVEIRRYPGMPHTINEEELAIARAMIERIAHRSKEQR